MTGVQTCALPILIDNTGEIVTINKQWVDFALENDGDIKKVNVGVNYFKVCERATGNDKKVASDFILGIKQVLLGNSNGFDMEYECHSPSQKRWFVARVTPFEAGLSKFSRAVISHDEVTHRKLAESMVRDSEERYSTFMNSATDIAYIKDENLRYVMINKAGLNTLKKTIEEVLGKTDFDLLDHEFAHSYSISDKEAIEKGRLVLSTEYVGRKVYEKIGRAHV